MDKDALLHQPQNPIPVSSSWKAQQELRAQLYDLVNEHLRKGGYIEVIPEGVSAEIDYSQCARNARDFNASGFESTKLDVDYDYVFKCISEGETIRAVANRLGVAEQRLRYEINRNRIQARTEALRKKQSRGNKASKIMRRKSDEPK